MSEVVNGSRVKVTLRGKVVGVHNNGVVDVQPDGARSGYINIVDERAEGVTIEVVEPEWQADDVVLDAHGLVFQRAQTGNGWLVPGVGVALRDSAARRPLALIARNRQKV